MSRAHLQHNPYSIGEGSIKLRLTGNRETIPLPCHKKRQGTYRSSWLLLPPRLWLLRRIVESITGIHHGTLTPSQTLFRYNHGTTERQKKRRTAPMICPVYGGSAFPNK